MKTITKVIQKEETVAYYQSFDGLAFDDPEQCSEHEDNYCKNVKSPAIYKPVRMFVDDYNAKAYYINNEEDFKLMKEYILAINSGWMNYRDIEPWEYSGADWYIYFMSSSCDNEYDDYVFTRFQSESNELSNKFQDFVEQFEDFSK